MIAFREIRRRKAFSLAELLIVIGIVAVLMAILLPVFGRAKSEALAIASLSNFRVASAGLATYLGDYDDRFPPPNYSGDAEPNALLDRRWVQLLLPYIGDFEIFISPVDRADRPRPKGVFDGDLIPGGTLVRYYEASQRSNIGLNHVYLAPMILLSDGTWFARTRSISEVSDPSRTLMFGESVWSVQPGGAPRGGGNYLLVPPCRFESSGASDADTFDLPGVSNASIYTGEAAWNMDRSNPEYGGLWGWHRGRLAVARVDGSARILPLAAAMAGCRAADHWAGRIFDSNAYLWDVR